MSSPFKNWYLVAALMLLLSSAAFGTDIQINGVCVQGTCPPAAGPSADSLTSGQMSSGSGSLGVVVGVDSDPYTVSWSYTTTYGPGGSTVVVNPMVVYTGASAT